MASVSISGTFRIIDQASAPMKKMEAQAIQTMAAVEALGKALDKNAGTPKQAQQMTTTARALRDVDRSSQLAARSTTSLGREMDKTHSKSKKFVGVMQTLRDVAGGLSALFSGIKLSALASAMGVAVQAVEALGGGVVALMPKLTDLGGVLAALPAAGAMAGQTLAAVGLGMMGVTKAIGAGMQGPAGLKAYNKELAKLGPSAQKFVKHIVSLKPAFDSLKQAAGSQLFSGLDKSVSNVQRMLPMLKKNLAATGGVAGGIAAGVTGDLTTPSRLKDLNGLMGEQTRMLGMVGHGFRNLLSAVIDLSVAAKPFTDWLFKTMEGWTAYAKSVAHAGRETGSTAMKLERTKSALQTFGSILHNLWDVMKSIGQAARPLGDSLWGGADRATKGWANYLKTAEGANKARMWFQSLQEPLQALGQLTKALITGLFGVGSNMSSVTATANELTKAVGPVTGFLKGAATLAPSLARGLAAVAGYLNAMPFSPIKTLLDTLASVLTVVKQLMQAIPGLGTVIATIMTVELGSKLVERTLGVNLLAMAWGRVSAAASSAAASQGIATGGKVGGSIDYGPPTAAEDATKGGWLAARASSPLVGKLAGYASRVAGRAGGGLGIGLGGSLVAQMAGATIGGKTGQAVGSVGSGVATGAGLGFTAGGPWGALAGGIAGGVAGAIQAGLFKGSDHAAEAGKKAGAEYIKGLGMSGIDPSTGKQWAAGKNPYQSTAQKIAGLTTSLHHIRGKALDAGNWGSDGKDLTDAQLRALQAGDQTQIGLMQQTGVGDPHALMQRVRAVTKAEMGAVPSFVQGVTAPRNTQWQPNVHGAGGILASFGKQFSTVGPQAQAAGARSLVMWAEGMQKQGRMTKGQVAGLLKSLQAQYPTFEHQFGARGKKAVEAFNAEIRKGKTDHSIATLLNQINTDFGMGLVAVNSKTWGSAAVKHEIDSLRKTIHDPKTSAQMRAQAKAYGDQLEAAFRSASRNNKTAARLNPKSPYLHPFGSAEKTLVMPPVNIQKPKSSFAELTGVTNTFANTTMRKNLPSAVKSTADQVGQHSTRMAQTFNTNLQTMTDSANSLLKGTHQPLIVPGKAFGGTLSNPFRAFGGALGYAAGGRIPGAPKGDHIPLVGRGGSLLGIADGGELVVNRHTERRVNGLLASHGTTLGSEVAGENKPHWKGFATGGQIPMKGMSATDSIPLVGGGRRAGNAMLKRDHDALARWVAKFAGSDTGGAGTVNMDGHPVAKWIARILQAARRDGVSFGVSDGFRSLAGQWAAYRSHGGEAGVRAGIVARPGTSNHGKTKYPGGAVDISPGWNNLAAWLGHHPQYKLHHYGNPADPYHFSAQGNATGGRLPTFGGWHAKGMNGVVRTPTLLGVGEKGPEHVKITPLGKKGHDGIVVNIETVEMHKDGDVAAAIKHEMEILGEELGMDFG